MGRVDPFVFQMLVERSRRQPVGLEDHGPPSDPPGNRNSRFIDLPSGFSSSRAPARSAMVGAESTLLTIAPERRPRLTQGPRTSIGTLLEGS